MESGTRGEFDDYSPPPDKVPPPPKPKLGGDLGPTGPTDPCSKAIGNILLEEVAHCDFFINNAAVPPVNTDLGLRAATVKGRLAIETVNGGVLVGYLPTKHNGLLACQKKGYSYGGTVISSSVTPIPTVRIDLGPK